MNQLHNSQHKKRTIILWLVPLIFVALHTVFVRRRAGFDVTAVDTNAAVQIGLAGLAVVLIFFAPNITKFLRYFFSQPAGKISTYYCFAAISAIWSVFPSYSLFMAFQAFIMMVLMAYLVSKFENFGIAESFLLKFSCVVLLFSIYPDFSRSGLGLYHTNSFSIIAAMMTCYAFAEWPQAERSRKSWLLFTGVLGVFGLVVGTSSGSNIATLCGLSFILILSRNHRKYLGLVLLL